MRRATGAERRNARHERRIRTLQTKMSLPARERCWPTDAVPLRRHERGGSGPLETQPQRQGNPTILLHTLEFERRSCLQRHERNLSTAFPTPGDLGFAGGGISDLFRSRFHSMMRATF
jgi:hypothetical protein